MRLSREVMAALPEWPARRRFSLEQLRTIVTAPVSLSRMAARARLIALVRPGGGLRAIVAAPTLIVQGDEALDHVTGSGGTGEYARLIRQARLARDANGPAISGRSPAPDDCADDRPSFSPRRQEGQSITVLREIQGPAGRLEALLEMPASRGVTGDGLVATGAPTASAPRSCSATRTRSSAARCTPRACIRRRRRWRASAAPCCASTSAASARATASFDEGRGELDDFRAALDFMAARYPGAPLWAGGMSFGSWVGADGRRRGPARVDAARRRAAGEQLRLRRGRAQHEAEVLHPRRTRRDLPLPRRSRAFYARAAEPKELVVIDGADHLFDGKVSEVADAIEDLLGDWNRSRWTSHERRRDRFRRSHGGRQGAEWHAARHAARRARAPTRDRRSAAGARPGIEPAEIDDVILGCAMPEAEQGLNVARIASLRAGIPVTASAVTVNRFCSSGLQAIAFAAERIMCGVSVGDRRRRHRVDEPDADGRPQGRAEPVAGRLATRTST